MSQLSIRWRIAQWNTAAFALILPAFGAMVYTQLLRTHYAQLDARLRSRLDQFTAESPGVDSLMRWAQRIPAQLDGDVAIVDSAGKIVVPASSGWASAGLSEDIRIAQEFKTVQLADGRSARRFITPLDVGDATYTVVMYADLAHVNEEMELVARALLITVPLALAAAVSLAYFLARKALAPIEQLRTSTDEITAAHLDRRLPVHNPNDELGLLTQTIKAMIERLDRSFREIRRFTADASHELRTPVAVIRSEAELALENAVSDDTRSRFGSILEECATLSWTTEQLLALCREDAGIDLPAMERVDLKPLVLGVVETMRPLAAAKRQVVLADQLNEASVVGCPQRLRQLVTNCWTTRSSSRPRRAALPPRSRRPRPRP